MIANKLCCPNPNDRSNKFLKCCFLRIFWEFGQFIVTAPDTIVANEKATEATLTIKTSLVSFTLSILMLSNWCQLWCLYIARATLRIALKLVELWLIQNMTAAIKLKLFHIGVRIKIRKIYRLVCRRINFEMCGISLHACPFKTFHMQGFILWGEEKLRGGDEDQKRLRRPFSDKLHVVTCEIAIRCLNILLPHNKPTNKCSQRYD